MPFLLIENFNTRVYSTHSRSLFSNIIWFPVKFYSPASKLTLFLFFSIEVNKAAYAIRSSCLSWLFRYFISCFFSVPSLHFLIAVTVFLTRFWENVDATPSAGKAVVLYKYCSGQHQKVFSIKYYKIYISKLRISLKFKLSK